MPEIAIDPLPSAAWLRFVVLSLPRTGSTYVKTTLDQHPNVISNGENLNPKNKTWQLASRMDAGCAESSPQRCMNFLQRAE